MQVRRPSLELSAFSVEERQQLVAAQHKVKSVSESAKSIGITPERLEKMQMYARELRIKFPHMKPARIQKKVAEHFKIKLV